MTDPRTGVDPDLPFAPENIVVWSGWATAGELAVLAIFMFLLPVLAGVVR